MKPSRITGLLLAASLGLARCAGATPAAETVAVPAWAAADDATRPATTAYNAMHPLIRPVDAAGRPLRGGDRAMDEQASCGACHDVPYIRANSRHWNAKVKVDCLACHFSGGALPHDPHAYDVQGRLKRPWTRLSDPSSEACLACHGVGDLGRQPLVLPESYLQPGRLGVLHPDHFSRMAGTVFSGQTPHDSGLNLAGKDRLLGPWDVHAARLLRCVNCHAAPNGPDRNPTSAGPSHLLRDPRHEDLAQFLHQPDHHLVMQDCRQCHDPGKTHAFLPYAQRHLDRLACQACHVPSIHAPVLMEEDRTVALRDGQPRQVWRNMQGDGPLNTRLITAFHPWLLPVGDGARLRPVNLVTQRAWVDASGREVAWAQVRQAWGATAPAADQGPASDAALAQVSRRLSALGVRDPHTEAVTRLVPIVHGIQPGPEALRRCVECHAPGGRMDPRPRLSLGNAPLPTLLGAAAAAGTVTADALGAVLQRPPLPPSLMLPGQGWKAWSTRLGFAFFLLTVLAVLGHALFRLATAQRRRHLPSHRQQRVYLFGVYERLWHWLMAISTLLLIYSGMSIHFAGAWPGLHLVPAVAIHNALAVVLLVNAFLSLFYHLATRRIRQFLPPAGNLGRDLWAQARYYLDGIFAGAPHPAAKSAKRKLNALQQLTYMALLNVLFPFQVLTGILLWMAGHWPGLLEPAGGLAVLTPLHDLGSWLLLSFTVGHLYLTTTGHSLTSNLKAMVDGWDSVDADDPTEEQP